MQNDISGDEEVEEDSDDEEENWVGGVPLLVAQQQLSVGLGADIDAFEENGSDDEEQLESERIPPEPVYAQEEEIGLLHPEPMSAGEEDE